MHPVWGPTLKYLKRSVYGEQVLLSIVEEMIGQADGENKATWLQVQDACRGSVYHRNGAAGHLVRLHFANPADKAEVQGLVAHTIACLYSAKQADKEAETHLLAFPRADDERHAWYSLAAKWHSQRKYWLAAAATEMQGVVPSHVWQSVRATAKMMRIQA